MNSTLTDAIIEWLSDHPQAKVDVVSYIKANYPELENELIFSNLVD